jgi:uncharacterized membrane protein YoaK (UPF0700 family)
MGPLTKLPDPVALIGFTHRPGTIANGASTAEGTALFAQEPSPTQDGLSARFKTIHARLILACHAPSGEEQAARCDQLVGCAGNLDHYIAQNRRSAPLRPGATMKQLSGETRAQWALAVLLALMAGYLDGYGLLFLGVFVSFMSGNTTTAGLRSGQFNFLAALPSAIAILCFVTGSFFANLLGQSRLRYSHRLIFFAVAGLLATVAVVDQQGLSNAATEVALLSLAMGMTNPALTRIGAESVSTTFVTGTLNRIGGHLAAAAGRDPLAESQYPGDSHFARARIDASVWSGFLVGAGLSGMAGSHFRIWALLPPCLVMIALGLFSKSATP